MLPSSYRRVNDAESLRRHYIAGGYHSQYQKTTATLDKARYIGTILTGIAAPERLADNSR